MKVVIIGGVAAGMSAAARLRRLDETAEIVVLERGEHVSFANCGLPYHIGGLIKERESLLLQTPQTLKASLNLDVRIRHEARAIDRASHRVRVADLAIGREYDEAYDKLVLCPGAAPLRPPLPGADHPRLFTLRNLADMDRILAAVAAPAASAVVIGGGYIGLEMAENLRHRGMAVELVEMLDQVLPPLDPEMARDLETGLRRHGVGVHLGAAVAAFHDRAGRIAVEIKGGAVLEADLAILAAGVKPDSALATACGLDCGPRGGIRVDAHLRTTDPDIYAAGDAIEVVDAVTGQPAVIPLAGPANRQGRLVADHLAGRDTAYPGTQGTAIVKLFDLTAGGTGASEKTLCRAGLPYRKIYLHPSGHAGYYPGTAPMHLKLLFAPDTGKILGTQITGYDGVDKRLDVFATAIRAGLTVEDLQQLELAYAPPYGAAKDPVNMAGFIAANLRRGDVAFWYAEEFPALPANHLVLDVRSPQEFAGGHLPGAANLPLGRLRDQLDTLPKDRPLRLYCKVGLRSYLAYRLLRQRGFTDVQTLAGGLLTFNRVHPAPAAARGTGDRPVAPAAPASTVGATGRSPVRVDCCGLQCPGPLQRLAREAAGLKPGDELAITATDPGFPADARAWCESHGHALLAVNPLAGGRVEARIRLSSGPAAAATVTQAAPLSGAKKKTLVVFSGELDRVLAAFVIANGAAAMGSPVTLFFTFWGLNALRRPGPQAAGKGFMDRMFGLMMPKGPDALKLSNLHFLGAGTAMMKWVMRRKQAPNLPELIAQARAAGVRIVACTMSMDVMGLKREELLDGIELGGVATFLAEADQSSATLFV